MEPLKINDLTPGDGVDLDNVRNIDAVVEAFLQAGANPGVGFPYRENPSGYRYLFWDGTDGCLNRTMKNFITYPSIKRLRHPLLVEQFGTGQKNPCNEVPGPKISGVEWDVLFIDDLSADLEDDEVNQPSHYKRKSSDVLRAVRTALLEDGDIEDLECIEAMLSHFSTVDQIRGYLRGSSFKYRWRYEDKDRTKSLRKARWYEDKLIELEEIEEEYNGTDCA